MIESPYSIRAVGRAGLWKRFDLAKFNGRTELGTLPLWHRSSWVFLLAFLFPVWFVYGWIRTNLQDAGITEPDAKTTAQE